MSEHIQLGHDGALRLLGHVDGMITALVKIKSAIHAIEYRYQHVHPRHTRKLAKKAAMLQPLRELEIVLNKELEGNRAAYDAQKVK